MEFSTDRFLDRVWVEGFGWVTRKEAENIKNYRKSLGYLADLERKGLIPSATDCISCGECDHALSIRIDCSRFKKRR